MYSGPFIAPLAMMNAAGTIKEVIDTDGKFTPKGIEAGVNGTGYDVKFFGDTAGKYFLWDESADKVIIAGGFDITGNSQFTGTVTVGVNDTGHDVKFFGATAGKYFLWDESADAVVLNGILQLGETTTTALVFGGGTSATKLTTATADKNFGAMYTESTAVSGDSRGLYWRHYLGGTIAATGFGDAIRAFCTVTGTGYSYASGLHGTMQINAGATVTGSGAGIRATLAAEAASRTLVGALAALQVDGDIGAGNTVPARCALIRLAKAGSVDVPYALDIADDQCLKGDATVGAANNALKIIMPDGSAGYILISPIS